MNQVKVHDCAVIRAEYEHNINNGWRQQRGNSNVLWAAIGTGSRETLSTM